MMKAESLFEQIEPLARRQGPYADTLQIPTDYEILT